MAQPPPPAPTGAGTISPDGRYIWNGTEWVANVPTGSPPPVKKGHKARNFGLGCLGLIVLILIIAALGSGGKKTSVSGGAERTEAATATCSPTPCANADSFTVSVTDINRNLPPSDFAKPEAGNHFVSMQVTLNNGSSDKKSANPFNFKLRDSQGQEHDIAFSVDPKCTIWQAVDMTGGATLGPKPLCFEAAGATDDPLTLIWSPDFFASKVEIPLQ